MKINPAPFHLAQAIITGLVVLFSICILGTSAHTLNVFNKQHLTNPWWAPMWPQHFDVQGTKEASEEKNDSGLSEALQAAAEFGSAAVIELLATLMDLESERPTGRLKLTSLHDSAFGRFHHILFRVRGFQPKMLTFYRRG